MTQVQISKQAAKTRTTRAAKVKPQQETQQAAQAAKIAYRMLQGFRPGNGAALFAHTAAFLKLSGMLDGQTIPGAFVRSIIGDSAVGHHTRTTGHFEQTPDGLKLSESGKLAFSLRHVDPELFAAYSEVLTTGKNDKVAKNPIGIKAI